MSIAIRNYRDHDLEAIVELINATDAVDQLDEGTDVADLRSLLCAPDSDAHGDALVVLDEDQRIVGFARLELKNAPRETRFYVHATVHPHWREKGVERLLLQRLWETAQERRRTLESKRVQFRTYCAAHQEKRIALFETFGLRPVRYSPHMVHHPLGNLPEPRVPPGIEVRAYVRGEDDQSALETINEAFADVMDFAPATLEELRHWIASSSFREELSPVALDGQEVVGLSLHSQRGSYEIAGAQRWICRHVVRSPGLSPAGTGFGVAPDLPPRPQESGHGVSHPGRRFRQPH